MKAHTPSTLAVTRHHGFGVVAPNVSIFAVQQGVPVLAALEYASCLLDTCLTNAHAVADEARGQADENKAWTTVYLLESVQAIVGSSITGLREVKP